MTHKKFNPKEYLGKDRIYRAVAGAPRVTRIYNWNGKEYIPPTKGKCYFARRYESGSDGVLKRMSCVFETVADARLWQAGEESEIVDFSPDVYTVSHLISDWRKSTWSAMRESTRIYYSKAVLFFNFLSQTEVERLTPAKIDSWLNHLKENPDDKYRNTRKSFLNELEIFQTILRWYIDTHDETKLVLPFKERHKKMAILREGVTRKKRFMLPEELEKWLMSLKVVAPEFFALAVIQEKQLLRISEAAAMKWENLNLANRSYKLCEHVIWPRVKGLPPQITPGTKNMKAGESFEMPLRDEIVELLKQLPRESELIFHQNGEVLSYRQIQYAFNKAFKHAGLPYSSTHILRHTGATRFLDETGDALALKQMGNWSDLDVALHYGEIMNSRAREALDKASGRLRLVKGGRKTGAENAG